MTIKTLEVTLSPQEYYPAGWYQDPATGQWYYYDEQGNRYVYVAGLLYPLATRWEYQPGYGTPTYAIPPITAAVDEDITITARFKYQGEKIENVKLYAAIGFGVHGAGTGSDTGAFQEGTKGESAVFTVGPALYTPIEYTRTVVVKVPSSVWLIGYYLTTPGRKCAIYAKVIGSVPGPDVDKTMSPLYAGAIDVIGVTPTFSEFKITDYQKV